MEAVKSRCWEAYSEQRLFKNETTNLTTHIHTHHITEQHLGGARRERSGTLKELGKENEGTGRRRREQEGRRGEDEGTKMKAVLRGG